MADANMPRLLLLLSILATSPLAQLPPDSPKAPDPVQLLTLQVTTAHVQGIDTDGVHLWVTSVDRARRKGYLQEFLLKDGTLVRGIELQDGDRYHPGGIAALADSIWIPVAEYKAGSTTLIQRRNKHTLELEFEFLVPDHIGCLAVTPDFLIGGNWDSREFYVWDHQGKLLRKVPSATANSYQDMKASGRFLIASGTLPGGRAAVDWLDVDDLQLVHRLHLGNTDAGEPLTREGMAILDHQLLLLPEDGASRLFTVAIPAAFQPR